MGLLGINKKIQEQIDLGKSREDIFNKFSASSPGDSAKYAYCLASIPYPGLRSTYLKHNGVLFLLLVILGGLTFASHWPIDLQESTLFIAITTLIPFILAIVLLVTFLAKKVLPNLKVLGPKQDSQGRCNI